MKITTLYCYKDIFSPKIDVWILYMIPKDVYLDILIYVGL